MGREGGEEGTWAGVRVRVGVRGGSGRWMADAGCWMLDAGYTEQCCQEE